MLKMVLASIERQDFTEALELALARWQEFPSVELGELVLRISKRIPTAKSGKTPLEVLASKDRVFLTEVLDWVRGSPHSVAMRERLDSLFAAYPDDPRISDLLFEIIGAPHWDVCQGAPLELATFVVAQLAATQDPRVGLWAEDLPALFTANKGTRKFMLSKDEIETLTDLFTKAGLPPGNAPSALPTPPDNQTHQAIGIALSRFEEQSLESGKKGELLLQTVIDNWDSDDAKQVYSDWLQEHDDVQGELIAIEMSSLPQTKEIAARILALKRQVRQSLKMPADGWHRGFPTSVSAWTGEGATAKYTEEQSWGTVQYSDIIPISDSCHTENLRDLRVAISYLKDLRALTAPLKVTCFGVINASVRARPHLRKTVVLRAVTTFELISARDVAFEWLLKIPWLHNLQCLVFEESYYSRSAEKVLAARSYFEINANLRSVVFRVGKSGSAHMELTRSTSGAINLTITARSNTELNFVTTAFAEVTKPSFEHVELRLIDEAPSLEGLGKTQELILLQPELAKHVEIHREGDTVYLQLKKRNTTLDVATVRSVLSEWNGGGSKLHLSGVSIWLNGYIDLCDAFHYDEAWFIGGPSAKIHRTRDQWLEFEMATYSPPLRTLSHVPGAKLRVRCNPELDLQQVRKKLEGLGFQVEATHCEEVRSKLFKTNYVKTTRTLTFKSSAYSFSTPTPIALQFLTSRFLEGLSESKRSTLKITKFCFETNNLSLNPVLNDWKIWVQNDGREVVFKTGRSEISSVRPGSDEPDVSVASSHE